MLKDGRVHYSDCKDCDAMLALKNGKYEHFGKLLIIKDRQMGFVDKIESAYKLCSCFANNHKGDIPLPDLEEQFQTPDEDKRTNFQNTLED